MNTDNPTPPDAPQEVRGEIQESDGSFYQYNESDGSFCKYNTRSLMLPDDAQSRMTPDKPTPRTDAFASSRYDDRPPEWIGFARQLERELNETKEKLAIAMRFAETRLEHINILTQKIP